MGVSEVKKRLRKKLGPLREFIQRYRTKRMRRRLINWLLYGGREK